MNKTQIGGKIGKGLGYVALSLMLTMGYQAEGQTGKNSKAKSKKQATTTTKKGKGARGKADTDMKSGGDGGKFVLLNTDKHLRVFLHNPEGKAAKVGDYILIREQVTVGSALLVNSFLFEEPEIVEVKKGTWEGDLMHYYQKMPQGDSVIYTAVVDSVFQGRKLPAGIKSGEPLVAYLKVEGVMSKKEGQAEIARRKEVIKQRLKTIEEDKKEIKAYYDLNKDIYPKGHSFKFNAQGVGVLVREQGAESAKTISEGDRVSIEYTLQGMHRPSSGEPERKTLVELTDDSKSKASVLIGGPGQMPIGVQSGLIGVKEGAQVTLYVPSPIGFKEKSGEYGLDSSDILQIMVTVVKIER